MVFWGWGVRGWYGKRPYFLHFFMEPFPCEVIFYFFSQDMIAKMKGTYKDRAIKSAGAEKMKKLKKTKSGKPDSALQDGSSSVPPNEILFVTNLPEETNEMMLGMLFNQVDIIIYLSVVVHTHWFCA